MKNIVPRFIAVLAYVGPPAWAYLAFKAAQGPDGRFVCGNCAIAFGERLELRMFTASGALSLFAIITRAWIIGWNTSVTSVAQVVEIVVFAMPFAAACFFAGPLFS